MPRVIHEQAFLRHIPADQELTLSILIGNVQHGEWWVWVDSELIRTGTDTEVSIELPKAERYYGRLIQVEVRCDDTNAQTDRLSSVIKLTPAVPPIEWATNNSGQESPHTFMTSLADIFVMPVLP